MQDVKGNITQVFFPHDDQQELVGLKKGNIEFRIIHRNISEGFKHYSKKNYPVR